MKPDDVLAWFEKIAREDISLVKTHYVSLDQEPIFIPQPELAEKWTTHAATALESVFPIGHAVRKRWDACLIDATKSQHNWTNLRQVFQAAYEMLRDGKLASFVDGVRAEAEDEILVQARQLVAQNYLSAAAVLAGGALESHLRRICEREQLTWVGDGSIAKYNAAISQARNQGKEIYDKADSSQVISWAQIRNDAAHAPETFTVSKDRVEGMIEQIAAFTARVP
jgi:hypothetical protein